MVTKDKIYDYIIIGAGISGCCVAHNLYKHTKSILIIDKLDGVAKGASGAAGAFLSPLLGKQNKFKELVTKSLRYSTSFYQNITPNTIDNCGTTRIPKNEDDKIKFQSYIPYMDFEYIKDDDGYFFKDASVVNSQKTCINLVKDIEKLFNYKVESLEYIDNIWIINGKLKTKNIILTTGYCINLIDEFYLNIRPVWGQRIDIETSTCITHNYHKECSVSKSIKKDNNMNIVSIGATHHRFVEDKKVNKEDTEFLLKKANDIINLKDLKVKAEFAGARASSVDYLPLVGTIIDGLKTLKEFPYLKNGTNVNSDRFIRYKNLYILNGVGGRGFVLAPYLANMLVEYIINDIDIDSSIVVDRLFKREVKRLK